MLKESGETLLMWGYEGRYDKLEWGEVSKGLNVRTGSILLENEKHVKAARGHEVPHQGQKKWILLIIRETQQQNRVLREENKDGET